MKSKIVNYNPGIPLWRQYQDYIDEVGGPIKAEYPDLREQVFGKFRTTGDADDAVPLDHAIQRSIINDFFRYHLAMIGPASMDARMCLFSQGPFEATLGLFRDNVLPYIQGVLEKRASAQG